MVLKNYQIPINLCAVLPSTQLETAARHVLNVFENMDTILNNNAPHEPITSATVSSVSFTSPSLPSYKDHTVSFLNVLIEGEVSNTSIFDDSISFLFNELSKPHLTFLSVQSNPISLKQHCG